MNFNAVLKDSSLRKVLVKCMDDADYSKLKSMAVKMHKDTEVKAGFDSVTFLVRPEEKFRLTLGAMLDLAL